MTLFDVAICTKNNAKTLASCLYALKRGVPTRRIWVIDAYSGDGTQEIARRFGCVVVESPLGLGQARRLGAVLCETEHFVSIDGDIVIPENFYAVLEPYVEGNVITKGIYRDVLLPNEKSISDRNFYWINHKVGSFDCCIINRRWFLEISEGWLRRGLDSGEDTDTYNQCEAHGYSVHQDLRVVSLHHQFNALRLIKQTRWYGRGTRRCRIKWRFAFFRSEFLPLEMLAFPVMGLVESFKWRSWRLFFFQTAKMIYWFWGYFVG